MLETASPRMSLEYPRVRDACESCHRRKIRCLLTPGSPACQSCLTSGDSCLFAPRAKAGRPRRTHSENQRRKLAWQAADNNKHLKTANQIGHARSSSDSLLMVVGDELQVDAIMTFDNYWDPEKATDIQKLGGTDFLTPNITPQEGRENQLVPSGVQHTTPLDGHHSPLLGGTQQGILRERRGSQLVLSGAQHPTPQGGYESEILLSGVQLPTSDEGRSSQRVQRSASPERQDSLLLGEPHTAGQEGRDSLTVNGVLQDRNHKDGNLGLMTPSCLSTPPRYDGFALADESLDFDTALKLCGDLDRSSRRLREGYVDTVEVKGMMEMVEHACTVARTAASSTLTEKASAALLLAAVYKVVEICEALIRQIGEDDSNADSLDRSFQLQRLDLAMFQAFMFLNHTGQVDALKKVSGLHAWISSIMQQQQYSSIW